MPNLIHRIFRWLFCITLMLFQSLVNAKTPISINLWHSMSGKLGITVNQIVQEFNASQPNYRIIPLYKGDYTENLTATIAAVRANEQPDIVQVFDVGTALLIHPKGLIIPVDQLMRTTNTPFNTANIMPAIRYYYSDSQGNLLAMPFNASSPVMFYNKNAFIKAGLNPNNPPQTWPALISVAQKLLHAGYHCGFTTGWPAWIQVESFCAWHNIPFATNGNGFNGLNTSLVFNNSLVTRQITSLALWQRTHIFQYTGREDEAMPLFTSGQCPILMESSGSVPDLLTYAKFSVGIARLPYWPDVKDAPQNTIVGGAALWVLSGHAANKNKGIAEFFAFLAQPNIQMQWVKATGYLPITLSAYNTLKKQGYYKLTPGAEVGIAELINKNPSLNSRGFRLGNYMAIRNIINQQLEAVLSGNETATQAMNTAVKQGNVMLQQFQEQVTT